MTQTYIYTPLDLQNENSSLREMDVVKRLVAEEGVFVRYIDQGRAIECNKTIEEIKAILAVPLEPKPTLFSRREQRLKEKGG